MQCYRFHGQWIDWCNHNVKQCWIDIWDKNVYETLNLRHNYYETVNNHCENAVIYSIGDLKKVSWNV